MGTRRGEESRGESMTITLPTQDEIVARIKERESEDILGFEWQEYVVYLDYAHARPWLKPETTAETWGVDRSEHTRDAVLATMLDYMPFAWEKANGCRGISSNRSVMHFIAWTWLAGDAEFCARLIDSFETDYHHYGKPQLELVCRHYGWDFAQWDNGRRQDYED